MLDIRENAATLLVAAFFTSLQLTTCLSPRRLQASDNRPMRPPSVAPPTVSSAASAPVHEESPPPADLGRQTAITCTEKDPKPHDPTSERIPCNSPPALGAVSGMRTRCAGRPSCTRQTIPHPITVRRCRDEGVRRRELVRSRRCARKGGGSVLTLCRTDIQRKRHHNEQEQQTRRRHARDRGRGSVRFLCIAPTRSIIIYHPPI